MCHVCRCTRLTHINIVYRRSYTMWTRHWHPHKRKMGNDTEWHNAQLYIKIKHFYATNDSRMKRSPWNAVKRGMEWRREMDLFGIKISILFSCHPIHPVVACAAVCMRAQWATGPNEFPWMCHSRIEWSEYPLLFFRLANSDDTINSTNIMCPRIVSTTNLSFVRIC